MNKCLGIVLAILAFLPLCVAAQQASTVPPPFQAVPMLPYRFVSNFFKFPKRMIAGEATAVAVNSKGHIFLKSVCEDVLGISAERWLDLQAEGDSF